MVVRECDRWPFLEHFQSMAFTLKHRAGSSVESHRVVRCARTHRRGHHGAKGRWQRWRNLAWSSVLLGWCLTGCDMDLEDTCHGSVTEYRGVVGDEAEMVAQMARSAAIDTRMRWHHEASQTDLSIEVASVDAPYAVDVVSCTGPRQAVGYEADVTVMLATSDGRLAIELPARVVFDDDDEPTLKLEPGLIEDPDAVYPADVVPQSWKPDGLRLDEVGREDDAVTFDLVLLIFPDTCASRDGCPMEGEIAIGTFKQPVTRTSF